MADVKAQRSEECSAQPQIPQDVVADIVTAPLHSILKSSTNFNQYEQGQLHQVCEMQEELPPYDSVSAERFVMNLDDVREYSCYDFIQWVPNQRSGPSIIQCPTSATYDDFLHFPSHSGCSFEQGSSVVSCFTDDLSHSTQCTETLSDDPLEDLSIPSPRALKNSMLQGCCQENHQFATRSTSNVTDWLCNVVCTLSDDTFLQEGPPLEDIDEQKDVDIEKPAA